MEYKIKNYLLLNRSGKNEVTSKSPILDLYPDVFLQILNYLPAKDLTTSYQVRLQKIVKVHCKVFCVGDNLSNLAVVP
jgi:hypothetical protein